MGQGKSKGQHYLTPEMKSASTGSSPSLFQGGTLDLCSSNEVLVGCSDDNQICAFNWREAVENYASLKKSYLKGHSKAVNKVCARKNIIFSVSRDLSLKIWNLETSSLVSDVPNCHTLNISALAATKDGSSVASGARDYSVKIRSTESCQILREYSSPRNIVTCLQFDRVNESLLYQGAEDLCLRVYDIRSSSPNPAKQLTGYLYFPISLDVHSDGNYLVTG